MKRCARTQKRDGEKEAWGFTCRYASPLDGEKAPPRRAEQITSYHFPVWTSEAPRPVLCQLARLDGRLRGPLLRRPVARTLAALPQIGSAFQCLWCLLAARSSLGQSNTARKKTLPDVNPLSWAFGDNGTDKTIHVRCKRDCVITGEAHTWCLFSMSRPSNMSMGWSSRMEKEQGRKSPSIWTWAAGLKWVLLNWWV